MLRIRGGDSSLKEAFDCNELASSVLADVSQEVALLRESLSAGEPIANFGSKADMIMASAMEKFDSEGKLSWKNYETKRAELEASVQNSLSPIFTEQICMLKGIALETFLKGLSGDSDGASAMIAAENAFVNEALASVPTTQRWSFSEDRDNLIRSMQAVLNERAKANNAKLDSAQKMEQAVAYLQMQQQQMRELQAEAMGAQGNKWTFGGAWRPHSDINLSTIYQQGRCRVQVQMVPDEGSHMLGPNGFTGGVGPANLGLSFNLNL